MVADSHRGRPRHRVAAARRHRGADAASPRPSGSALLLVGHVTKDGQIAGPKVIEHMVDTVLYFEGDRGHQFRILRAVKNRFGPTDEIGVFEMRRPRPHRGRQPVALFTAVQRSDHGPGTAVFAGIEGSRPLLMEIQALVSPSSARHAAARRGRLGSEPARHAARRAGGPLGRALGAQDVYLNVAGGLKPARAGRRSCRRRRPDLLADRPRRCRPTRCSSARSSLSGAVRAVGQSDQRLKEAARLGLSRAVTAAGHSPPDGLAVLKEIADVAELTAWISAL
jgi:DNA repair protein RadA/Sms